MQFNDQTVVITGASKGFGKALAAAFNEQGAKVIISSTNKVELQATASELSVDCFVADSSSFDETKALAEYVTGKHDKIDVWVNNAGIQIAPSDVEAVEVGRLHDLFNLNFFGYFYGCMVALTDMKLHGRGLIININSTAGLSGKTGLSAYVSSKYAIKGLSETIRAEVQGTGIKLFQIFPGGMQTDIYKEQVPNDISDYMSVDYAVTKVMDNLLLAEPDQDLVIKRPTIS